MAAFNQPNMNKEDTQLQLYRHYLSFFLPEGILDFFDIVWMEPQSLDSCEAKKDIIYAERLFIHLDEKDNRTSDMQDLRPNGFTEPTVVADFPARERRVELHIRRRRWLTPEGKNIVLNLYQLAAPGTRYSAEFAAFLKDAPGHPAGDGPMPG